MHHDLVLAGPVVSLRPLRTADAGELAAVTRDSPDVAEDLRWHTSPLPTDERTARSNIEALVGNPAVMAFAVVGSGDTNPAAKLLMLTHAFETWGCVRVALRCDAENERSARAIVRLGARPEGVLRNHRRRHDGTVADTAYFSVIRDEWPEVRAGLRARVAP
jgi:N-acetyltransferase